MDRVIVYPGAIPLDTDVLTTQRNTMNALGYLVQATLGAGVYADGLVCTQTTVASMNILVGPGSMTAVSTVDATAFGSLAADTVDPLVKMGVNITPTTLALTAPGTTGQSINYLIQAAMQESDATPVVLPYYNSSNPAVAYSGPANAGTAQNTVRKQIVAINAKAGTPATTGTQTSPAADSGFVGLYVVTVAFAATTVINANISTLATAPFIQFKVPALRPGFSSIQVFTASGTFTVPAGVTKVKATVIGGGGGSGSCSAAQGSGAGGAGGATVGLFTVTPAGTVTVTIGTAGTGGVGSNGGAGGASSFGIFNSSTGGSGGTLSSGTNAPGGAPGVGSGGSLNIPGGYGADGQTSGAFSFSGPGGASMLGGGGRGASGGGSPAAGQAPGSGAGGVYGGASTGQPGAAGVVIVEW